MALIRQDSGLRFDAVVFGTDLTVFSQNAGHYSALLAKHFSAKLVVAHAFILSQSAMLAELDSSLISEQRKDLSYLLANKAASLASGAIPAEPILSEGEPAKVLTNLATNRQPSLVVLGTHGGGNIERGIIGSVAEGVLRSSSQPTITVGPKVPPADPERVFQRILYVTDAAPVQNRAASCAVDFAKSFHAEIDMLSLIRDGAVDHPESLRGIDEKFYRGLETLIPPEDKALLTSRHLVQVGRGAAVLRHISECAIDLLVLGLRNLDQEEGALTGQMKVADAFYLIIHAPCPVLTVVL